MQSSGEFNTNVMLCRADQSSRDLCRSGKSLGGHATGAQLVAERTCMFFRFVFGQQIDDAFGRFKRCFPKNGELHFANDPAGFAQQRKIDIGRNEHFQLSHGHMIGVLRAQFSDRFHGFF